MAIEIWSTDTEFKDSPDTGWPECTCSRCGEMIEDGEMPLRCYNEDRNTEYRYCEDCQSEYMGITYQKSDWNDDPFDYPYPVEED